MTSPSATLDVRAALVALVNRLREVHADDAYKSVWTINQIHAGPYTGPTYTAELEAAMVAIACDPSRNLHGVAGDEMDKGAERAALLTRLMAAGEPRDTPVSETPLKLSYPVRQTDEHLDCLQQGNGRYLCEAGSITLAEWLVHDLNAKAPQNERVRKLEEQNMEDYTFLLNIAHDFGAKDGEDMREVIYKGIAELRAQASLSAIAAPEPVEEERYTIPTTKLVPAAGKKDWGRAKVGLDGNCGYALLGENLQDGEAEFVEIEGWPEPTYTQEREAWGKALRKLEARLGSGLLRYEVIR